jgi:hypothetical protein
VWIYDNLTIKGENIDSDLLGHLFKGENVDDDLLGHLFLEKKQKKALAKNPKCQTGKISFKE